MNVQHILVPIDFSSDAEQALDCAVELAQQFQARLTLIHVIHIVVATEVNLAAHYADLEVSAQQEMETYAKRVGESGIAVETMIVYGTPYHEIVETAKTKQVDLIVMGTHGRTGMQHLFVGSVAERVVRLAPCPVMVTRETRHQTAI